MRRAARLAGLIVSLALLPSGCSGKLVRLAKQSQWAELDRQARARDRAPRGAGARAWAQALVALERSEEARALLLRDFRLSGQERSLLALADLERALGLRGIAAVHYGRLAYLDPDTLQRADSHAEACALLLDRVRAEAALGEALAADADLRALAQVCPDSIGEAERALLSSLHPQAQAQAEAQRRGEPVAIAAQRRLELEQELVTQLELARKRGPRAVAAFADAARVQVTPDDVAVLLAAEFGGALGVGLVSISRLSAWVGDNDMREVYDAVDTLPDGAREYALLRLASVRVNPDIRSLRETWIVAAGAALLGQGPREAAKGWRISACVGQLSAAEFALNTNLRDMIPVQLEPEEDGRAGPATATREPDSPTSQEGASSASSRPSHWSARVPVDRRSFDLLLALARLLAQRGQTLPALELRRFVLVAGYEAGLAPVGAAAVEELRRQLILGHPWQALAIAEVVPGPLLDEAFPAIASALALARARGLDEALAADENLVWRALGDDWVERWRARLDAAQSGLALGGGERCPPLARWLDPEADEALARVGLDPERSRAALELAIAGLDTPAAGSALADALEADLAFTCSAPLVPLLGAGQHRLRLEQLDERLVLARDLEGVGQLQLHAELALAHGADERAALLSLSAAARSSEPRELWTRAAIAGLDYGAREYTIEALRQVLLHSDAEASAPARRELLLMRLRDVDGDTELRAGKALALDELRAQLQVYLDATPHPRRWARLDALLWRLADEPRADTEAWARLLEVLDSSALAGAHPHAIAALHAAAARAGVDPALEIDAPQPAPAAHLSDSRALCEAATRAGAEQDALAQVGAALACGERSRAQLLATLYAEAEGEQREALRAALLQGPRALDLDPERPASVTTVAALAGSGLTMRVLFGLELEPAWALVEVEGS